MGILYIVATPIGNLQDITLRAIDILQKVDFIACEDTRKTGMLLKILQNRTSRSEFSSESRANLSQACGSEIPKQVRDDITKVIPKRPTLISYYEQNEFQRISGIINSLKNGCDVALVSDAGTPTISDPGFRLVRKCIKEGIRVESIPGPSSVISALVVSGLPTDKFLFLGYPPHKPGHRKKLWKNVKESLNSIKSTVIFFEAPHKLIRTLEEFKEIFGDINIVICRELTKVYEEVRREKISESLGHFSKTNPKGEFVILFNLG